MTIFDRHGFRISVASRGAGQGPAAFVASESGAVDRVLELEQLRELHRAIGFSIEVLETAYARMAREVSPCQQQLETTAKLNKSARRSGSRRKQETADPTSRSRSAVENHGRN